MTGLVHVLVPHALSALRAVTSARAHLDAAGPSAPPPTAPPVPFQLRPISPRLAHTLNRKGPLESVWLCVAFAAAAAAVGAGGVFVPLRRRGWRARRGRHRWLLVGGAGLALLLALAAVAAGVNTYAGFVPDVNALGSLVTGHSDVRVAGVPQPTASTMAAAPAGTVPAAAVGLAHSQVVRIDLHSPEYGLPDAPAYVYLPTGYGRPGQQWPLLILIGGAPGTTDDWLTRGHVDTAMDRLIHAHVVEPFVIVMPTTNRSFFEDNECLDTLHGPRVETYLINAVLPAVRQQLSVATDRARVGIAGFSAGADCALNVGLHHLDTFSTIAALDPEGWPGYAADRAALDDRPDLVRENSPRDYIPTMTIRGPLSVYLNASGPSDVPRADLLQRELQARGVYVYRHDDPKDGHTWRDPHADAPWMLDFLSAAFAAGSTQPAAQALPTPAARSATPATPTSP